MKFSTRESHCQSQTRPQSHHVSPTVSPITAPLIWHVVADCPQCCAPLVLRQTRSFEPFVACGRYPACRFTSAYDRLVHSLLDKICWQWDLLEDLGHPVERNL
jgi:hypothetical protein